MRDSNCIFCYFVFLCEYRHEIRCPREEVFEAALDESSCRLVAALFRKKTRRTPRKDGGRASETIYCCRCACNLEENKVYVLVFHGDDICTTFFVPGDAAKSGVRLKCYSPIYFT